MRTVTATVNNIVSVLQIAYLLLLVLDVSWLEFLAGC